MDDAPGRVIVSRRIAAPASVIFDILRDPSVHVEFDGSGMLRESVSDEMVSGVGDVFVMRMFASRIGDYTSYNHVVEFEANRRLTWEPGSRDEPTAAENDGDDGRLGQSWSFVLAPEGANATLVTEIYDCSRAPEELRARIDDGEVWREAMTSSLEHVDRLCRERLGQ